jgi:hypothetical protein
MEKAETLWHGLTRIIHEKCGLKAAGNITCCSLKKITIVTWITGGIRAYGYYSPGAL